MTDAEHEEMISALVEHGVSEDDARAYVDEHGIGRAFAWLWALARMELRHE